jgi:ribosomal-protein-alanine N-acetyltransferase
VSLEDADEITALVLRNLEFLAPWDPARDEDYATEAVQRRLITEALDRHAADSAVPLVITDGHRIVGRINVNDIVRGPFLSAHLGYWVSEDCTGRGVACAQPRLPAGPPAQRLHPDRVGTALSADRRTPAGPPAVPAGGPG